MTETLAGFFGGGGNYAKFPTVGATVRGRITRVHPPEPQTDIQTRAPIAGKYQVRIELATEARDSADDDGARVLYVRSWMTGAIGDALKRAGATEPAIGGTLSVTYVGDGQPTGGGFAPKLYAAEYTPPSPAAGFFNGAPAGPAAGTLSATARQAPAPAGPPPGISADAWRAMPEAARQAILTSAAAGIGFAGAHSDEPPF